MTSTNYLHNVTDKSKSKIYFLKFMLDINEYEIAERIKPCNVMFIRKQKISKEILFELMEGLVASLFHLYLFQKPLLLH